MIELEIFKKSVKIDKSHLRAASTFAERLQAITDIVGGKSALSRATGVSISGLGKYLDGGEPSISKFEQICKSLGIRPMWALRGEEPILEDEGSHGGRQSFSIIPHFGDNHNDQSLVQCAFGADWLTSRGLDAKSLKLLSAQGDSMEPTIEDGNSVLIDTSQKKPAAGGIFVFTSFDHILIRRTQHLIGEGILLISDNKTYQKQVIPVNGTAELQVIGKVVWIGKETL